MRKYVAVTIIAILVILWAVAYGSIVFLIPTYTKFLTGTRIVIGGGILIALITFIKIYLERIKEIKEEDDDDLSKY